MNQVFIGYGDEGKALYEKLEAKKTANSLKSMAALIQWQLETEDNELGPFGLRFPYPNFHVNSFLILSSAHALLSWVSVIFRFVLLMHVKCL